VSAMGGKVSATEGKSAATEGARPAPMRKRRPVSTTGCSVRACLTQLPSDAAMHASNPEDQMKMRMHPREVASRVVCTTGAWRRGVCGLRVRA
jgi:hypothetical protein